MSRPNATDATDVEVAIAAAEAGAAVVRRMYGEPLARFAKSPTDFATEADIAAERQRRTSPPLPNCRRSSISSKAERRSTQQGGCSSSEALSCAGGSGSASSAGCAVLSSATHVSYVQSIGYAGAATV